MSNIHMIKKLLISLIFISSFQSFANSKKIVLVADYWCPYNCYPNSNYEGYLVEIARIAFAKRGIEVEYKVISWSRAVEEFNHSKVDGIIGASPGDVLNPIFSSVPVGKSNFSAYTIDDSHEWKYKESRSLGSKVLGIVEGYKYSDDLKNYVYSTYIDNPEKFYISSSINPIDDNLTKLLQGEISVYVEDENVVKDFTTAKKIASLRNAGSVKSETDLYIAFPAAKENSVEFARLITDTYLEMRANGKLKELAKKYKIDNL